MYHYEQLLIKRIILQPKRKIGFSKTKILAISQNKKTKSNNCRKQLILLRSRNIYIHRVVQIV